MSELNELLTRWLAGAALAQPAAVSFAAEWLGWLGLGVYLVVWLVTSRQFSRDERWTEIIFAAAATLAAWAASELIKKFYFSPRPFEILTDLAPLLTFGGDDSFPSAHAAAFFALAFAVRLYRPVVGNFLIFVALAVSAARVAALLHWPSDILGGFLLAGLVVFVLRSLVNYLRLRPAEFRL